MRKNVGAEDQKILLHRIHSKMTQMHGLMQGLEKVEKIIKECGYDKLLPTIRISVDQEYEKFLSELDNLCTEFEETIK